MLLRVIGLTLALLMFAGCGQGFSGDYQDAVGVKYSFQNDGKVTIHMLGTERVVPFTREGRVLKIGDSAEKPTLTLNILDDGSLQGEGLAGIMHLKKTK